MFGAPEVSSTDAVPTAFLQPEVVGTYLPGTGTWAGGPGVCMGLLDPKISFQKFYPPHVDKGVAHSMFAPLIPV